MGGQSTGCGKTGDGADNVWRLALEAGGDGVWDWDVTTGEVVWSHGCYTLLGYPPGAFTPTLEHWRELLHPDDLERATAELARHLEPGSPGSSVEFRVRAADGSWRWLLSRGRVVARDEAGRPLRMVGTHTDIDRVKGTEAALRESEERYRRLLELAPDAMFANRDGRVTYVNAAALRLFGAGSPAELLGGSVFELFHPDCHALVRSRIHTLLEHDQPVSTVEERVVRLDGTVVDVEVSAAPLPEAGGTTIQVVLRDVTERKRAEAALRRYELLAGNTRNIILFVDPQGWILEANEAAVAAYGYPHEELLGRSILDLRAPEGREQVPQQVAQADSRGLLFETVHQRRDGTTFPVEVSSQGADVGGQRMLISVIRDITERKAAEEALRQQLELQDQFLKTALTVPGAICTYQRFPDGRVTMPFATPAIEEVYGLPREALAGDFSSVYTRFHPDDVGHLGTTIDESARTMTAWHDTYRYHHPAKGWRWIEGWSVPQAEPDGSILWHGFVMDITERKEAEAANEALAAQLRQAQKMEAVGRLAGGVAHDFNNMLAVILGYSDLALSSLGPSHPIYRDLREIADAARRSSELTRQLLAFSRQQVISPQVLRLNHQLEGMARLLHRTIGEDITLRFALERGLGQVYLDPSQIDQVVANLAVNARDAMPEGGELTIRTANVRRSADGADLAGLPPGDWVMLAVSDTGCGMDEQTLAHVFEPFFTTKPDGQGTGLGMATVYGIVQQNGGHVELESRPAAGTTVRLYLPRCRGVEDDAADTPAAHPAAAGSGTVLLVEDQDMVRSLVARMLERLGYRVLPASGAAEALSLVESTDGIDALLTDLVMPGMSGSALADELRRRLPGLPTLFMSGYPAETMAERGVLEEGLQYLQKPFTAEALGGKLREVMGVALAG